MVFFVQKIVSRIPLRIGTAEKHGIADRGARGLGGCDARRCDMPVFPVPHSDSKNLPAVAVKRISHSDIARRGPMSFAFARSRYRQADTIFQETATKPYDVVFVTLKELSRALGVLAAAQDSARPLPADHVNRALTAIYILQSSLDFELGGDRGRPVSALRIRAVPRAEGVARRVRCPSQGSRRCHG